MFISTAVLTLKIYIFIRFMDCTQKVALGSALWMTAR
jgi:hypothetical protein